MPTVTRDLWPPDIKTDEAISPMEILRHQGDLLESRTNGILRGVVVGMESDDRRIIHFDVEALRLQTKSRLFSVEHRREYEYPVRVMPPTEDLPDYLQSHRYVPGRGGIGTFGIPKDILEGSKGKWVEDRWVATSPQEFTEKIGEVLATPAVKAVVLSLISRSANAGEPDSADDDQNRALLESQECNE